MIYSSDLLDVVYENERYSNKIIKNIWFKRAINQLTDDECITIEQILNLIFDLTDVMENYNCY